MLAEQVAEAEHDRDAAVSDSSATVVRAGQYRDLHAAVLEVCGGAIDVLLPVGMSVQDHLGNVLRWFREAIRHAVCHEVALALAATSL
jgi:hypothetical protein